jgi:lipopolysaccharide biosynthesis protein
MGDALPDAPAASIAFRRTSPDSIIQEASLEVPLGYAPAEPEHPPSIAVVLHAFHLDLLPEIAAYLDHIPFAADCSSARRPRRPDRRQRTAWRAGVGAALEIRVFPNRGRDIAPKLVGFADVHERYEYVLHLHTKISSHQGELAGWRGYILETLLGSPDVVRGVFEAFRQAPWLGILAPQHIDMLRPWIGWGINLPHATALAARMGLELSDAAPIDFPSGSMFWARSAALRRITGLSLRFEDFPAEEGQTDGTPAHAIERLYFLACEAAGFGWMKIAARGQLYDQDAVTAITRPVSLAPFLSRCSVRLTSWKGEAGRYRSDPAVARPIRALAGYPTSSGAGRSGRDCRSGQGDGSP